MEEYQRRMVAEYTQSVERQNSVMIECLQILEKRAAIEGISLATNRKGAA